MDNCVVLGNLGVYICMQEVRSVAWRILSFVNDRLKTNVIEHVLKLAVMVAQKPLEIVSPTWFDTDRCCSP